MSTPVEATTLEQRLARIEAIVSRLESDRLELDDALALFEEGVTHLRAAERMLAEAELRIERVVAAERGGILVERITPEPE